MQMRTSGSTLVRRFQLCLALLLQSGTSDFNVDGKPDELRISMSMPLAGDEVITGVTAIAWLNVQLTVSLASLLPC